MNINSINLEMFIEFPGILITIGGVLLLISIIIGIIAYKKEKDVISADNLDNSSNEEINNEEEALEKPPIEKEEINIKQEEKEEATFTFPPEEEIEDIKTEPIPIINENNMASFEEVVVVPTELEKEENKEEKEITPEIKEEKNEEIVKHEEKQITIEEPKEKKTTLIYGGEEPTRKFNFSFNKEKATFEDKKPEEIVEKKQEEIKPVVPQIEEDEEEIELL